MNNYTWTKQAKATILVEDEADKLSRNTFNFLELNKGEMKVKFHWNALNKHVKWAIKLIVSRK